MSNQIPAPARDEREPGRVAWWAIGIVAVIAAASWVTYTLAEAALERLWSGPRRRGLHPGEIRRFTPGDFPPPGQRRDG